MAEASWSGGGQHAGDCAPAGGDYGEVVREGFNDDQGVRFVGVMGGEEEDVGGGVVGVFLGFVGGAGVGDGGAEGGGGGEAGVVGAFVGRGGEVAGDGEVVGGGGFLFEDGQGVEGGEEAFFGGAGAEVEEAGGIADCGLWIVDWDGQAVGDYSDFFGVEVLGVGG